MGPPREEQVHSFGNGRTKQTFIVIETKLKLSSKLSERMYETETFIETFIGTVERNFHRHGSRVKQQDRVARSFRLDRDSFSPSFYHGEWQPQQVVQAWRLLHLRQPRHFQLCPHRLCRMS